eukprot:scaffold8682_cov122-Cylindrotheca_fusiformis.AAC.7
MDCEGFDEGESDGLKEAEGSAEGRVDGMFDGMADSDGATLGDKDSVGADVSNTKLEADLERPILKAKGTETAAAKTSRRMHKQKRTLRQRLFLGSSSLYEANFILPIAPSGSFSCISGSSGSKIPSPVTLVHSRSKRCWAFLSLIFDSFNRREVSSSLTSEEAEVADVSMLSFRAASTSPDALVELDGECLVFLGSVRDNEVLKRAAGSLDCLVRVAGGALGALLLVVTGGGVEDRLREREELAASPLLLSLEFVWFWRSGDDALVRLLANALAAATTPSIKPVSVLSLDALLSEGRTAEPAVVALGVLAGDSLVFAFVCRIGVVALGLLDGATCPLADS